MYKRQVVRESLTWDLSHKNAKATQKRKKPGRLPSASQLSRNVIRSSCRACEAAFGCEAVVKSEIVVCQADCIYRTHDCYAAERSLAGSAAATWIASWLKLLADWHWRVPWAFTCPEALTNATRRHFSSPAGCCCPSVRTREKGCRAAIDLSLIHI